MISKQFSLINFTEQKSVFRQFCEFLNGHELDITITKNNIIHVPRECCPDCDKLMAYNGFYESSSIYYRSNFVYFKVGQQYCSKCNKTHIPKNKFVRIIATRTNEFLSQQMVSLSEKGLSYADISSHLGETLGVKITPEHVSNVIENYVSSIDLANPLIYPNGWYCYDEQHLKQNGKTIYRIVIYQPKTLSMVYEKDHEVFNQQVLKDILSEVFNDVKPLGFTFDMAPSYPKAFTDIFGKKIPMQWCIFHLNKLILQDVRKYLRIGSKVCWSLEDVHQMYEVFGCFYERQTTVDYIIGCKQRFQQFKSFIEGKGTAKTRNKDIKAFEKMLVKDIFRYQHQLKLMRKRTKETLRLYSKEEALRRINDLIYREKVFIKPLKKRINYILDNFNKFIVHLDYLDAEHTNNKLEGKFGVTLRKTEKIKFRSRFALQMCLKLKRMKDLGAMFLETFSMGSLALIGTFGILCGIPS